MKTFETTVVEEKGDTYIHLTGARALAHGRGRVKRTLEFKMMPKVAVNVDLDQTGRVVGVRLLGFEIAK